MLERALAVLSIVLAALAANDGRAQLSSKPESAAPIVTTPTSIVDEILTFADVGLMITWSTLDPVTAGSWRRDVPCPRERPVRGAAPQDDTTSVPRNTQGVSASRRRICRSWMRESNVKLAAAPISAKNMSDCVSHGSPCVPRNSSAP